MLTALRLARLKTNIALRSFARLHRLDAPTPSRVMRGIQYVPLIVLAVPGNMCHRWAMTVEPNRATYLT